MVFRINKKCYKFYSILLVNKKIIGFIENSCPEENLQGFHWPKTIINKGQDLSCPSPCTGMYIQSVYYSFESSLLLGEISRFCNSNSQWSKADYTNCECPIEESDQVIQYERVFFFIDNFID
jgi:hypothetical protein